MVDKSSLGTANFQNQKMISKVNEVQQRNEVSVNDNKKVHLNESNNKNITESVIEKYESEFKQRNS